MSSGVTRWVSETNSSPTVSASYVSLGNSLMTFSSSGFPLTLPSPRWGEGYVKCPPLPSGERAG